jgi:hypothetical protein
MSSAACLDPEPYDPFAEPSEHLPEPVDPFADTISLVAPKDPFAADAYPNLVPVTSGTAIRLNVPRVKAQKRRALALVQVATGAATLSDVISQACAPDGGPLLSVRLKALLEARPGAGRAAAFDVMTRLSYTLGDVCREGADLAWLLDGRARGRYVAWLTATGVAATSPWPGFPFTYSRVGKV